MRKILLVLMLFLVFTLTGFAAVEFQNLSETKINAGTEITITAPAGFSAGDLFVAYITKDGSGVITPPAGDLWTTLQTGAGGTYVYVYTAYRIAEEGDTDWTWTGAYEGYYGVILRYTGHDPDNPIHISDITTQATPQYNPVAPSVNYTALTEGSRVFQCFGADDNDIPYSLSAGLTSRFNDSVTTSGGAGGDREAGVAHWTSASGWTDPESIWNNEFRAYDNNTSLNAWSGIPAESWGSYLELSIDAISCTKVRFWAYYNAADINQISLDVYYSGDWHNIYEGAFANEEYVEKAIGSTQTVTGMRMKFYNTFSEGSYNAFVYDTAFWALETLAGSANAGAFGMVAAEEWAAVTVIIEATEEEEEEVNAIFFGTNF